MTAMRPVSRGLIAFALLSACNDAPRSGGGGVRQSGSTAEASADDAGRTVLRAYVDAATRGDPEAMLALYSSTSDISSVAQGDLRRGRDAVRADLDSSAGPDARFQLTAGTADVRRLGDSAMLVVAPVTISAQTDTGPARIHGALTLVAANEGGAWRIVHDHFSFVPPRR